MPTINGERLLGDLDHLRSFGALGNGVVRPSFSEVDMASREWLRGQLVAAGLDARIDGIGNVLGISQAARAVLIGSHTDTQPTGGWLDGAYGVIAGLEVARAFAEDEGAAGLGIDVASWMDEESTFLGCMGSRSFCGLLLEDEVAGAVALDGRVLREVLVEVGLDGVPRGAVDAARQVAYLEAHIEQGPVLDRSGDRVGVVTDIVGYRQCVLQFSGEQNHAGTTPMTLRRDAGMAMIRFAAAVDRAFEALASGVTVWTMGTINLSPNAPSIVPGRAVMQLQFRDSDGALLRRLEAVVMELVAEHDGLRGVGVEIEVVSRLDPMAMDGFIQDQIAAAAEAHGAGVWRRMPSGAVHDAQVLASQLPSGMVFVPSIGGVSHSFEEDTRREDLVLGCQVLCDAAFNVLSSA